LYKTEKIIPAQIEFIDIAGLVAGASKGEGLGNKFLANIRECAAIVHVVRAFENDDIIHVNKIISPKDDIEIINTELILADIQTLETHIPKVQKLVKADSKNIAKVEYLTSLQNELMAGKMLHDLELDQEKLDGLQLLTTKPTIFVFNVDEKTIGDPTAQKTIAATAHVNFDQAIFVSAKLEAELKSMSESEKQEFLKEYGVAKSGLEQLVVKAYEVLGLQSYLTAGEKEVRAWTVKKGATAPEAAGVIHTDFEHGFIAAQIVDFDDLIAAGDFKTARENGKVRTEGKTYLVQPGDIIEFRFNN
jgi:GTP-binding protein YchF